MSIKALLSSAAKTLAGHGLEDTARIDAECLLMSVLNCSRTYFYSHNDTVLPPKTVEAFNDLVGQRSAGKPVAYIVGSKEFWSLSLTVDERVLIPRPETECLIEAILGLDLPDKAQVADIGTGSGAIALALASEKPAWSISACDISTEALAIAKINQQALQLPNISCLQSNYLDILEEKSLDLLVSNPPYINPNDKHLAEGDVRFEPSLALVAKEQGLQALRIIIEQAWVCLKPGSFIVLEHGYDQGDAVCGLLNAKGYSAAKCYKDLAGVDRYCIAAKPS